MTEQDTAERLSSCYTAARDLTAALRRALDADQVDRLDQIAGERQARLDEAASLVEALVAAGVALPASQRTAIAAQLEALIKEDQRLRAALAARALELPTQMAELRGAQAALGGYEAGSAGGRGDSTREFDRRG